MMSRGEKTMYIHEDIAVIMIKERMEDAKRYSEQRRALRLARASRPATRVRLGMLLIRFGRWLMGESPPPAGTTINLGQAQS
jgi:hypothetical protein